MTATIDLETTDPRLIPILTRDNVAALIGAGSADVKRWTAGPDPAVQRGHSFGRSRLTVPFVGLVEADLIQHFRRAGMSIRRINNVLRSIRSDRGELTLVDEPKLVTDGSDPFILEGQELMRTYDAQTSHQSILAGWLTQLEIGDDGAITEYRPKKHPNLSVNPRFNGGKLTVTQSRIPVWVIVDELRAGTPAEAIAKDYQVDVDIVREILNDISWAEKASA